MAHKTQIVARVQKNRHRPNFVSIWVIFDIFLFVKSIFQFTSAIR
jgi:hypothetical protein